MEQVPEESGLKERLGDRSAWHRLLFILLFTVIYSVVEVVLCLVVVFQFLCVLIVGEKNQRALSLGSSLSSYTYRIFRYLTFNSDERPYPFADWPSDSELVLPSANKPAARKPAARRSASRAGSKSKEASPSQAKPEDSEA